MQRGFLSGPWFFQIWLERLLQGRWAAAGSHIRSINAFYLGVPRQLSGKESICQAGDPGLIPESGTSPRERNVSPLQYSCLGNPMDRGAWWPTACGVTKNRTWLSTHTCLLFRSSTRAREHELRIWAEQMNGFRGFMTYGLLFAPQLKRGVLLNPLVFWFCHSLYANLSNLTSRNLHLPITKMSRIIADTSKDVHSLNTYFWVLALCWVMFEILGIQ